MSRIIPFANQKGGVGKTTTVQNLAAAIHNITGDKPLIIDLDPQSNLTEAVVTSMDYEDVPFSSSELLLGKCNLFDTLLEEEYCHLIPCKEDAVHDEAELMKKKDRLHILKRVLEPIEDEVDFILIDCPASLGAFCSNAFVAATEVMIPVECEFFSLSGLTQLMKQIDNIKSSELNKDLHVSGVIATKFQENYNLNSGVLDALKEKFGELLFDTPIRKNTKLGEAPSCTQSIFQYSPTSNGAKDYRKLAEEILSM